MPSPGYEIELMDDKGGPCDVGEKGEIVVRTDDAPALGNVPRVLQGPRADGADLA